MEPWLGDQPDTAQSWVIGIVAAHDTAAPSAPAQTLLFRLASLP